MKEEFLKSINQYQGIIIKVCRMYCADNEDAEDLFQDILFQLWRSWPTFNSAAKLSTWMYRISLNTAITRLRKNKRRPLLKSLSLAQHSIPNDPSERLDILFDEELQDAIASLDKMDRGIVMLYLDEKSYKEIAEIMGLSESNVGVKINRIKEKLRKTINRR